MLYINVNTHEQEKYWFAYNIGVELQQVAAMEANPAITSLVGTWSVSIAGVVNIGTINVLQERVKNLVDIFIKAYLSANARKAPDVSPDSQSAILNPMTFMRHLS